MLAADFWFEGEFAILFADTNLGKSPLAVQFADVITGNRADVFFKSEARPQVVVLLDFELSDKQFQARYSLDYEREYLFNSSFVRVTIQPEFTDFDNFEKQLFSEIESVIIRSGAKVLIVDNLTYLRTQSTETSKEALPLMRILNQLKKQFGLSILALAHTPKRPDQTAPLTLNDLAGSKNLSNFADAVFCIGRSCQSGDLRYLKQLKARSCPIRYDGDNVAVFTIGKPFNYLAFEFVRLEHEQAHLKDKTKMSDEVIGQIADVKRANPALSLQKIAHQFPGLHKTQIARALQKQGIPTS